MIMPFAGDSFPAPNNIRLYPHPSSNTVNDICHNFSLFLGSGTVLERSNYFYTVAGKTCCFIESNSLEPLQGCHLLSCIYVYERRGQ